MTAPELRMQVTDYAGRYFDEQIAPMHTASGVPPEALDWMRRRYIADVHDSEGARQGIAEHYGVDL